MGPHEGIIYSEIADYNKFEEQVGNEKILLGMGKEINMEDIKNG